MNLATRLTFVHRRHLAFHSSTYIFFGLANECSLVLARALGLPTASFWGFGYQGGEVTIIHEINLDSESCRKYWFGTCKYRFCCYFNSLHICNYNHLTPWGKLGITIDNHKGILKLKTSWILQGLSLVTVPLGSISKLYLLLSINNHVLK